MILPWRRTKKSHDPVSLRKNPESSELELDKWKLSRLVLEELVPRVGVKPFPLDELIMMAGAMAAFEPKYVFEWGTHKGVSARVFYETARVLKLQTVIYSVDLPDDQSHPEHPGKRRGELVAGLEKVFLFQGDGVKTSLEIYQKLNSPAKVLFFLDGDHSYSSVKRELQMIFKAVNDPIILVHDTFFQSKDSGYNTGPIRAIDKVVNKNKYQVISTSLGLPGMSLIVAR